MCLTCFQPRCQVCIIGRQLAGLSFTQLKDILTCCGRIRPHHVVKQTDQSEAYVHFVNEVDTATFFWRHALQEGIICRSLSSVSVLPTLASGVPTIYARHGGDGVPHWIIFLRLRAGRAAAPATAPAPASREEDWLGHLKRARDGLDQEIVELVARRGLLVQKRRRLDRLLQDE